jgi:iron(III) transport system permease protein
VAPPRLISLFALAVFAFCCVVPAASLAMSLAGRLGDPGVARAAEMLAEPSGRAALLRTAGLALCTAGLCVAVGVPYAVLLSRTAVPGRGLWAFLTFLGLLTPPYFSTVGWTALLGFEGALTRLIPFPTPTAPIHSFAGALLVSAGSWFPVVPLLIVPALRRVRPEVEDAARLETGLLGVLRRVTIPSAMPEIAAAAALVFALCLGSGAATDLLAGARTYPAWLMSSLNERAFDTAAATVLALPLLAAVPLGLWAAARAVRAATASEADGAEGEGQLSGETARDLPLGPPARLLGLAFVAAVWTLTAGVPLGAVAVRLIPAGGTPADALTVYIGGWRQAWPAVADSLPLSAAAGLLAAAVSLPLAAMLRSAGPRWGWASWAVPLLLLPAVMPAVLTATGLVQFRDGAAVGPFAPLKWLLGRDAVFDLAGSRWRVRTASAVLVTAYLARFLPVALVVTLAGLRRLDRTLTDAAAVDGAGPWRVWRHVILPVAWPYAAAGGLAVFALSLGEIETVLQVVPPRVQLLSAVVYDQAHRNLEHNLAGLCAVMMTAVSAAALAAWGLLAWAGQRFG